MVNLERVGEIRPSGEINTTVEVLEMDKDLVGEARLIFENNHELVKEAMFGLGSRKAKEVLDNLAKCREQTKEAVRRFRVEKEKIYSRS